MAWSKNTPARRRRLNVLASTDKNRSIGQRYREACEKMRQISKNLHDLKSRREAKKDYLYFERRAKVFRTKT